MKKSEKSLFVLFCMIFCSCKTIQKPQNITEPLDYTSQSVIQNEIDSIRKKKNFIGKCSLAQHRIPETVKKIHSSWTESNDES